MLLNRCPKKESNRESVTCAARPLAKVAIVAAVTPGRHVEMKQGHAMAAVKAMPQGNFRQNVRGFYHFFAAQPISAHDCKLIMARLKELNAAPQKGVEDG